MGSTSMPSNDDLAHRFRAAAEARDVIALAELYDPDARFWNNVLGGHSTTAQVLEISRLEAERIGDYRFDDVRVSTTDSGFVLQITVVGVTRAGDSFRVPACLVARTENDRITAIDEYVDSAHAAPLFAALLGDG
jgi:ketosteroid isomerase-like protein